MLSKIISPLGSAVWLRKNTTLTNKQICQACGVDMLELPAAERNVEPFDCIKSGQFNIEDIRECEKDSNRLLPAQIEPTKSFNISRMVLKLLKNEDQMLYVVAWLVRSYPTIRARAVSLLLKMSLASATECLEQVKIHRLSIYKNPIEARLFTESTIKDAIIFADREQYAKNSKKLSDEQIAGISNWLLERYGHMSYVYDIMKPISEKKINQVRQYYTHLVDPIEMKILDEISLNKYSTINAF